MNKQEWMEQVAWEVTRVVNMYKDITLTDKEYRLDVLPQLYTKTHRAVAYELTHTDSMSALDIITIMVEECPSIVPSFEYEDEDET